MEKGIKDLLIDELHDILSSEEQIVEALPAMVTAADSPELKKAFQSHLTETKGQIRRLEKIFKLLDIEKKEEFCEATKGLIKECKEVLQKFKNKSPFRDASLISKAQRIEHYEIAAYGTVRAFAKELGLKAVAALLKETLDEESGADEKLTKIANGGLFKSGINHQVHLLEEEAQLPKAAKGPSLLKKGVNVLNKVKKEIKIPTTLKKTVKKATKSLTPSKKTVKHSVPPKKAVKSSSHVKKSPVKTKAAASKH